jgi:hypothetical protein
LRRVAAVSFLALSLVAAKPRGKTPKPPPEPTPAPTQLDAAAMLENLSLGTKVELLDAGAEPRAPIRFLPAPGKVVTVEQYQDMTMSMTMNGRSMPIPPMSTISTTRNSVGTPDASGRTPVTVQTLGTRAAPGTDPSIAAAVGNASQMTAVMLVDADGRFAGISSLQMPDAEQQGMAEVMAKKLAEPLALYPLEPIGVGGVYRSTFTMDMSGLAFEVVSTARVTDRGDTWVDMETDLVIRPGDTSGGFPGLPAGVTASFDSFSGTGHGTQRLHLDTLVTETTMEMTLDMGLSMSGEGQAMKMAMAMQQKVTSKLVE